MIDGMPETEEEYLCWLIDQRIAAVRKELEPWTRRLAEIRSRRLNDIYIPMAQVDEAIIHRAILAMVEMRD